MTVVLQIKNGRQTNKMIASHKADRVKPATQDGRESGMYRNRWKVEKLFCPDPTIQVLSNQVRLL